MSPTQYDGGLIQNLGWKNILYFNTYFIFDIIFKNPEPTIIVL